METIDHAAFINVTLPDGKLVKNSCILWSDLSFSKSHFLYLVLVV